MARKNVGGKAERSGVPLVNVPGMSYGPVEEAGVVCLFALLSKRLGFNIEQVRKEFPDCLAVRRRAGGWERVRIEFEFRAKSFLTHRHDRKCCDIVVCWENNWEDAPKGLEILELRRYVEPQRIWLQSVGRDYWDLLDQGRRWEWSLPMMAKRGDLVMFWHRSPRGELRHLAVVTESAAPAKSRRWRGGIRVVECLEHPVTRQHIMANAQLRDSTFVRSRFQGRFDVTPWWADFHLVIGGLNPGLRKKLDRYFAM